MCPQCQKPMISVSPPGSLCVACRVEADDAKYHRRLPPKPSSEVEPPATSTGWLGSLPGSSSINSTPAETGRKTTRAPGEVMDREELGWRLEQAEEGKELLQALLDEMRSPEDMASESLEVRITPDGTHTFPRL